MIRSKRLVNLLFHIEKYILEKADKISAISLAMAEKIRTKTSKPVYVFPNWADTKLFYPLKNKNILKSAFGLNPDVPVILYSGSIGEKQGLDAVPEIAVFFMKKKISAQFIICGSGPYHNTLEKLAAEKQLNNLSFLPLQPLDKLNDFLNMADVHLVIQKANVADHVMPSKLTTILSVAGLAIVTANTGSGLYKMVLENNIGLLCIAEDSTALANTIEHALKTDYSLICNNARKYVEDFLSIDKIMMSFKREVLGVTD